MPGGDTMAFDFQIITTEAVPLNHIFLGMLVSVLGNQVTLVTCCFLETLE